MKKNVLFLLTVFVLILLTALWYFVQPQINNTLSGADEAEIQLPEKTNEDELEYVTVQHILRPHSIRIEGRVRAQDRLEIFPEVQAQIAETEKTFSEGTTYQKGEVMIRFISDEMDNQLRSVRSSYQTLIASILPDIKLDYPDHFDEIESWFREISPDHPIPPVPETDHTQLRRFLAARGIIEKFYQIKSIEEKLQKFLIRAPFTGVLSAVNVEPGQSVGPQNHIGTLINPGSYILTAAVSQDDADSIHPGITLDVSDQTKKRSWQAVVDRINPSIHPRTQQVEIYLRIDGHGLMEGLFLEGELQIGPGREFSRIPKSALLRTGHVYTVQSGVITETPVQIIDLERETVWVSGLKDGDRIVRHANRVLAGRITNQAAS